MEVFIFCTALFLLWVSYRRIRRGLNLAKKESTFFSLYFYPVVCDKKSLAFFETKARKSNPIFHFTSLSVIDYNLNYDEEGKVTIHSLVLWDEVNQNQITLDDLTYNMIRGQTTEEIYPTFPEAVKVKEKTVKVESQFREM